MQLNTLKIIPNEQTRCPLFIFDQSGRRMSPAKRGRKSAVFAVRGTTTSGNTIRLGYCPLSFPV